MGSERPATRVAGVIGGASRALAIALVAVAAGWPDSPLMMRLRSKAMRLKSRSTVFTRYGMQVVMEFF